ncbi:MMPL family transporter [Paenibacillus sp. CF384]|uniref:MMPL family transporter n=1 Tax=Paenibacillus sp. CF384 TaxID=1884382 RepID=UPI00089BFF80|nr:MMPL family transporter [Paenibacillus sp. CF384]SDX22500.1 putative drug exporter of the RND superfamily [Paenibacillus sp. CF384]
MVIKWLETFTQAVGGKRGRWLTLAAWIIIVALLNMTLPSSSELKDDTLANFDANKPSVQAEKLIAEQFPSETGIPALLTWYRANGITDADLTGIQQLAKQLAAHPVPHQESVVPLDKLPLPALKQQVSEDGTTLVQPVLFDKTAGSDGLKEGLTQIEKETALIFKDAGNPFQTKLADESGSSDLAVRASGPVGISVDATGLFKSADVSLLLATVFLVLLFLLLIYRSPVLALIPLIAVGFAYGAITPLLGWMADQGWIAYDSQSLSIMTVLLFGAGTDYCLFLIARFRSELKEEGHTFTALKRAFSGSSGAIAMSGLTVVFSLLVLLLAEFGSIQRFAVPFSLAILIMMIASLTLVPALLSLLGRASFYPFIPRTPEMAAARAKKKGKAAPALQSRQTLGDRLGEFVVRKPKRIAVITTIILVICVIFATQIKYTFDTLSSFPADSPSREGFTLIADHFNAGELAPVQVIAETKSAEQGEAVHSALAALPFVKKVTDPVQGASNSDLLRFEVELAVNPYSIEAIDHIPQLRHAAEQALTATTSDSTADTAKQVWIGGQTAEQYDTKQTTGDDAKLIIPAILILIAILLLAYLRSFVAMLYLIATVLLSYYSALGLGWVVLHYLFGTEAIQGLIPLYSFVFIVALGEDYNIFMISSIWKKARHMPLRQAVKEGVSQTGSVITSAGLILAGTFAVLATLPIQVLVQFGTITAIGVLLDTFIVRPFLVPAITVLCGRAAFWPAAASKADRSTHISNES